MILKVFLVAGGILCTLAVQAHRLEFQIGSQFKDKKILNAASAFVELSYENQFVFNPQLTAEMALLGKFKTFSQSISDPSDQYLKEENQSKVSALNASLIYSSSYFLLEGGIVDQSKSFAFPLVKSAGLFASLIEVHLLGRGLGLSFYQGLLLDENSIEESQLPQFQVASLFAHIPLPRGSALLLSLGQQGYIGLDGSLAFNNRTLGHKVFGFSEHTARFNQNFNARVTSLELEPLPLVSFWEISSTLAYSQAIKALESESKAIYFRAKITAKNHSLTAHGFELGRESLVASQLQSEFALVNTTGGALEYGYQQDSVLWSLFVKQSEALIVTDNFRGENLVAVQMQSELGF